MKKFLLFILLPLLSIGQTQIGADIDGEAAGDLSGSSVSLSSDGSTLAIGSPNNIGSVSNAGSVRVYKNVSGTWTQIGDDIDGQTMQSYTGRSVSLSGDGNILAIGAPNAGKGSVRVFKNVSGTWTQIGANIDGEANFDQNGWSVSLSIDGTTIAIGAFGANSHTGYVRVFKNISGTWTKIGANIDGEAVSDGSGFSVSLSGDGLTLAIGSPYNARNGRDAGTVRVYNNISGIWTQIGANIDGEVVYDWSGYNVSFSNDGNILAIGSPSNSGTFGTGTVRVYKNISGIWTQIGDNIDGEAANDFCGYSVSLSGDGATLAIGSPSNDGNGINSGTVRIYKNVSGIWTQIGLDIDGENADDWNGYSISLSNDGTTLAIGADFNDGSGEGSGSVRVYDLSAITLSSDSFVLAHFSVYPNPASELVTISLEKGLILEKVNVYNILGQLVKTENKTVIAVNSLVKGNYFFEVITNKGKATKKIIVQ